MSTYREMAVPSSSARDLLQQRSTTRIRTLVVDDTMDILSTVCALLEQHPSIDVIGTAANGLEGLQAAGELRPDLVLLDVSMPVMNGLEAALRLSQEMPWIKILMMSADDSAELEAACMQCGADAFLWKGSLRDELEAQLKALSPQSSAIEDDLLLSDAEEEEMYEFHNEHYEYYRDLLEYAQSSGSMTLARSAARMLLFHLQQMFRCLPREKQQSMKSALALGEM